MLIIYLTDDSATSIWVKKEQKQWTCVCGKNEEA